MYLTIFLDIDVAILGPNPHGLSDHLAKAFSLDDDEWTE
jgi:hypothetical protein